MNPIIYCRCGSHLPEHERTAHCSEAKPRVALPVGAAPEQTAALVTAARDKELAVEAQIFKRPAVNGGASNG